MQTGHCSRCGEARTTDRLNGYNPLTGDFSNAYCRHLADCESQEAQAMADELLSELDPLPTIEVDELPVSAALESLGPIDRCDRTPPGVLIRRYVTLNLTVWVGNVELDVAHIPDLMVGDLIDLYLQVSHQGSAGLMPLPPRSVAPFYLAETESLGEGYRPASAKLQLPLGEQLDAAETAERSPESEPAAAGHPGQIAVPGSEPVPDRHGQCPQCGQPVRQSPYLS